MHISLGIILEHHQENPGVSRSIRVTLLFVLILFPIVVGQSCRNSVRCSAVVPGCNPSIDASGLSWSVRCWKKCSFKNTDTIILTNNLRMTRMKNGPWWSRE